MDIPALVTSAAQRLRDRVRRTPVQLARDLSVAGGCRAHLKLECWQRTGSFKLRGAFSRMLALDADERARGVVTASTGNHGLAVVTAAGELGCGATVFAPRTASAHKLAALTAQPAAAVERVGDDCLAAEAAARAFAAERGMVYVSPYNDPLVIAGQGTVGHELHEQLDGLDVVVAAVGGGGLIAGIAGYLKHVRPDLHVVGVSPRASAVLAASIEAGRLLDLPSEPTLSDGTAGGVEPGSITFEACRDLIDEFVLVEEDEIAAGVREMVRDEHLLVEGAAGAAVAGFRRLGRRFAGRDVAIVLCGANIEPSTLKRIL